MNHIMFFSLQLLLSCSVSSCCHVQSPVVVVMFSHKANSMSTLRNSTYTIYDVQVSGIPLPLPPKKVFGKNERPFLVERQQGLQTYLEAILKEPSLASLQEVKRFLDPRNYSENFYGMRIVFRLHPAFFEFMKKSPRFSCCKR